MKSIFGGLCFLIMLAFGFGLFVSMLKLAWNNDQNINGFVAFFGFGLPMIFAGAGAFRLFADSKFFAYLITWIFAISAILWSAALFYLIAGWVGLISTRVEADFIRGFGLFFGFAVPMVLFGFIGISLLVILDENKKSTKTTPTE